MSGDKRPLLADLKAELGSLGADLREMLDLRCQLARIELESDLAAVKRLAIVGAVAGVMMLTALPVLMIWAAEMLDACWGISRAGWLLIFGLALLLGGAAAGGLAWRHFRARFTALEQTREELREDLEWLREGRGAKS